MNDTTVPRPEKAYEKHAWIILFAWGIFGVIGGSLNIVEPTPEIIRDFEPITGTMWSELLATNPRAATFIDFTLRSAGILILAISLLMVALSLKAYRKGEKWAWYALWTYPVYLGLFVVRDLTYGAGTTTLVGEVVLMAVVLVGLLLPYRKFFPKK